MAAEEVQRRSRRVRYAGDVVIGAVTGATIGDIVGWGLSRQCRPRECGGR